MRAEIALMSGSAFAVTHHPGSCRRDTVRKEATERKTIIH
jgi:hypothetical protein